MNLVKYLKSLMVLSLGAFWLFGCGSGDSSISVLPSLDEFEQHDVTDVKIDILFVIDDSGSMKPIQDELRANFQNFINNFYDKGFDFRVAVAKTSAYGTPTTQSSGGNTYYEAGRTVHEFRCGAGNNCGAGVSDYGTACTGTYGSTDTTNGNGTPGSGTDHILSSLNLSKSEMATKFSRNADVGLCGTGGERGIESAETVLRNMTSVYTGTEQFPRPGAHMAVVHVGDEPDGKWSAASSSNTNGSLNGHTLSGIYKASSAGNQTENEQAVQSFLTALGVHETTATVSVHAIESLESSCINSNRIAYAQMYMASIADGMEISICDDFAGPLAALGDHISSLASAFPLSDILDQGGIDTLTVYVEGLNGNNPIPESSTNGYTYDQPSNSVVFHGSMVPPQGAIIGVTYTCTLLDCNNP